MGVVSPCGIGLEPFWDALINCKSGIGPITRFDASDFPVKIAGEVKDFDMRDYFGPKCRPRRYSFQTQYALAACQQALNQAGLTPEMLKKEAVVPVILGVASRATHLDEEVIDTLKRRGATKTPMTVRSIPPAATAGAISQVFGFQISATTISDCCPSGLDAVNEAAKMIRDGRTDLAIAGAADSYVTPITVAGFSAVRLTSSSTDFPPEKISRPFDLYETNMIKKVFKNQAYKIPVSSIRGVMGHALASSSLMQLITCALSIKHKLIPPTANLTCPDPACDLDYVPLTPRQATINTAIINSRGMAKENSTVVVKRV
jgi:3-oxoacyl-(acyl-carrier-protein) synthase